MNLITLQPGEIRQIPLTGRFLVVRTLTGKVVLSDPHLGLPEFEIKQSDNLEFDQSRSVTVRNAGDTAAQVELQSSPVKIFSNDGGSVKISGGSIQSIIEPIQVTAEATVQNGTVTSQSQTTVGQVPDITIPPSTKVKVLGASSATKRTAFIQCLNSSGSTYCRLGGSDVTATSGLQLSGTSGSPGALEIDLKGELWVFNTHATNSAKIAVMWGER
jgi:hypothetical protein